MEKPFDFTQTVYRAPRYAATKTQEVLSDVFGIATGNPTDEGELTFTVAGPQICLGVQVTIFPSATNINSLADCVLNIFLDGERLAVYQIGGESFRAVSTWQIQEIVPYNKILQGGTHRINWTGSGSNISAAGWRCDLILTVLMQEV